MPFIGGVMNAFRLIFVWLLPPVLAGFAAPAAYDLAMGIPITAYERGVVLWLGVGTLVFTIPGSGLLWLAFLWTGGKGISLPVRYTAVVVFGVLAGAAMAIPFGTWQAMAMGVVFALLTALLWIAAHRVLIGNR